MTEVQKYWRDRLMSLLVLGGGFLFVVGGWSISEGNQFTLFAEVRMNVDSPEFYRALGLIGFVLFFSIVWLLSTTWIYRNHLLEDVDATVLPARMVYWYIFSVIALLPLTTLFICL